MAASSFWQSRHRAQCILLFLVGLIAYGQHRTPEYWTMWVRLLEFCFFSNFFFTKSVKSTTFHTIAPQVTLMIFQAMILIADLMFLSGNQYDYDPYYKVNFFHATLFYSFSRRYTQTKIIQQHQNWARKQQPKY